VLEHVDRTGRKRRRPVGVPAPCVVYWPASVILGLEPGNETDVVYEEKERRIFRSV
jgi:hypothetical protein